VGVEGGGGGVFGVGAINPWGGGWFLGLGEGEGSGGIFPRSGGPRRFVGEGGGDSRLGEGRGDIWERGAYEE